MGNHQTIRLTLASGSPARRELLQRAGYSFAVLPRLGELVAGDGAAYRYLAESIRRFPPQPAFAKKIEKAGFTQVKHRNLSGGIAAIHSGWKA